MNADGSFTYTPDAGFEGQDSFTYDAFDGLERDTATVTIEVGLNPNTTTTTDTGLPTTNTTIPIETDPGELKGGGCSCQSASTPLGGTPWFLAFGLLLLRRKR